MRLLNRLIAKLFPVEVGSKWTTSGDKGNPFCDYTYVVEGAKDGFVLYRYTVPSRGYRALITHSTDLVSFRMAYTRQLT